MSEQGRTDEQLRLNHEAELDAALEAVLMVAGAPVSESELADGIGVDTQHIVAAIGRLVAEYAGEAGGRRHGFELRRVAGGWRVFSRGEYADVVGAFLTAGQSSRLSQAALETLAVVAYQQPVSRARIAAIRGVNVDGVVRTLLMRGLIVEAGSDPGSGAQVFATTGEFLQMMGMDSLSELPEIAPYLPEAAEAGELGPHDL